MAIIRDGYDSETGRKEVRKKVEEFGAVISRFEEIYNVRPFTHQTAQSLAELFFLVQQVKPKTIIEIGCGSRSSTVALATSAAALDNGCRLIGVDIAPVDFDNLMKTWFPGTNYCEVKDVAGNAIDFYVDEFIGDGPVLMLYDAHDDDLPGVKIFPHAKENWFPKLKGHVIAVHDCSLWPDRDKPAPEGYYTGTHFSGRCIVGYGEVPGVIDMLNENKTALGVPHEEMSALGASTQAGSSLIYFTCP